MGKRKQANKAVTSLEEAIRQGQHVNPPPPQPQPQPLSLAEIRAAVLKAHTKTAHTIADLEAWRAEIEATIAFLKARGR